MPDVDDGGDVSVFVDERWGRCVAIVAGATRAVVSLDFGPRIVSLTTSLSRTAIDNLLWTEDVAAPAFAGKTRLRAGHRLWTAPETEATWVDDEGAVDVDTDGFVVGAVDGRGLVRAFRVRADGDDLLVEHRVHNPTALVVEVAAWGVTMFRRGARIEVQLPAFQPHPEAVQATSSLSLWPYTRLDDPRLQLGARRITVAHEPGLPPWKIGGFLPEPALRVLVDDTAADPAELAADIVVEKRWQAVIGAPHADQGCNWEIYVDNGVIEAESLSPLVRLHPGELLRHDERWSVRRMIRAG